VHKFRQHIETLARKSAYRQHVGARLNIDHQVDEDNTLRVRATRSETY